MNWNDAIDPPDCAGESQCFLGLPDVFSAYENSQFAVIPVPFGVSTSYQSGTEKGPEALIGASRYVEYFDVETELEAFRAGIHTMEPVCAASAAEMLAQLEQRVASVRAEGKVPVTLGGEHTVSYAPIAACAKEAPLSVLQFDAHADLREAYQGNPLSHASVMAQARKLSNVQNIVGVGLRALDRVEFEIADRADLFFDHELQQPGWEERVLERLADRVYISFDLDVFCGSLMPSTGTPEPGGPTWFQVLSMLQKVCASREIVGFDIVELMPIANLKAPDFLAAKLTYKIINYIVAGRERS